MFKIDSKANLADFDIQKVIETASGGPYQAEDFFKIYHSEPAFKPVITNVELQPVLTLYGLSALQSNAFYSSVNLDSTGFFYYCGVGNFFFIDNTLGATVVFDYTQTTLRSPWPTTHEAYNLGVADYGHPFFMGQYSSPGNDYDMWFVPSGTIIAAAGGSFDYLYVDYGAGNYLLWSDDLSLDLNSSGNMCAVGDLRYAKVVDNVDSLFRLYATPDFVTVVANDAYSAYSQEPAFYNCTVVGVTLNASPAGSGPSYKVSQYSLQEYGKRFVPKFASSKVVSTLTLNVL